MPKTPTDNQLLEPSCYEADDGNLIGRDPRKIAAEDWPHDLPLLVGLKAIRAKCLDCAADNTAEVRKCTATTCPLWPLRTGAVPKGFKIAREQRVVACGAVSAEVASFEGQPARESHDA